MSGDPSPSGARPGSGEMFDGIAPRYDLLNRLISLGLDQGWRRRTVAAMALGPGRPRSTSPPAPATWR